MSLVDTCLVDCPYCGEVLEFAIDCPDGRHQYTEDCHVCFERGLVVLDRGKAQLFLYLKIIY